MKTKDKTNLIISIIILCIVIGGIIFGLLMISNKTIMITSSICIGILGLIMLSYIIKLIYNGNKPETEKSRGAEPEYKNLVVSVIAGMVTLITAGVSLYFFSTTSTMNHITGTIILCTVIAMIILYLVKSIKK